MSLLCLIGLHRWEPYRSGAASGTPVTRSWCPRCKADSILFGTYREVTRGAWNDKTPAEFDAEWNALREELRTASDRLRSVER